RASEVCDLQCSKSSYPRAACTFTASRTGLPAYIRSAVTRYVLFVSYATTTSAALPRTQDHPAHGQVCRNGARPVQGLLERLILGLGHLGAAASGRRQARDHFRFPFDHLGICRCVALGNQLLDDLDPAL